MRRRVYSTSAWKQTRLIVLERDGWRCKIKGARCTHTATEVDHIIPVIEGGAPLDVLNLRAACKTCNLGRVIHRRAELARFALSAGAAVDKRKSSRNW